jgi:uncharacterized protein (TIGR03000 family)
MNYNRRSGTTSPRLEEIRMFGKRLLSRLALSVAALGVLAPAAPAGDWFWYPQALFYRPWDWSNSYWPSNYLYFTGSNFFAYYAVHYPMGGEDTYIVTPADIKWVRDQRKALLEIRVPYADAALTFDGKRMYREGRMRRFVTPKLEAGSRYTYEVQASWLDDSGKDVKQTKQVQVAAGQRVLVDFTQNGNGNGNGK